MTSSHGVVGPGAEGAQGDVGAGLDRQRPLHLQQAAVGVHAQAAGDRCRGLVGVRPPGDRSIGGKRAEQGGEQLVLGLVDVAGELGQHDPVDHVPLVTCGGLAIADERVGVVDCSVVGQGGNETGTGALREIEAQVVVEARAVEHVRNIQEVDDLPVLFGREPVGCAHAHHGSGG